MAEKEATNIETEDSGKRGILNLKNVVIFLLLLVAQSMVVYLVMGRIIKPKILKGRHSATVQKAAEKQKKKNKNTFGEIYLVEDVIVNPKGTMGRRFVNISVGLECMDKQILKELEKRDIKIRDYLISLFSNQMVTELDDASDKIKLRNKILSDVNAMLNTKGVRAVYFTNFVLQ